MEANSSESADSAVVSPTVPMQHRTELLAVSIWRARVRWFIPEFLVVVSGVLMALAVNAGWQERSDRAKERGYLLQLQRDLASTEQVMRDAYDSRIAAAKQARDVAHAFWHPAPRTLDDADEKLRGPMGSFRRRPLLGTAEALVSTGSLDLIRPPTLRSNIVAYIESSHALLEDLARYDETYFRPAVIELRRHFDPAALWADREARDNTHRASSKYELGSMPLGERTIPFPVDLSSLLNDKVIYDGYEELLLAHRQQARIYGAILTESLTLRAHIGEYLEGHADAGNCQLEAQGEWLVGNCGALLGEPSSLRLKAVESVASGRRAKDWNPDIVYVGTLTRNDGAETTVELESALDGGVARTEHGWFPLVPSLGYFDGKHLSFRIDTTKPVDPNDLDREILKRARELLPDEAHWDRADDRKCLPNARGLSLYCALRQATIDVTGGFHHRRPALEQVRVLVEERTGNRGYEHRLRDYNNDPTTRLSDLYALLDEALKRSLHQ